MSVLVDVGLQVGDACGYGRVVGVAGWSRSHGMPSAKVDGVMFVFAGGFYVVGGRRRTLAGVM